MIHLVLTDSLPILLLVIQVMHINCLNIFGIHSMFQTVTDHGHHVSLRVSVGSDQ